MELSYVEEIKDDVKEMIDSMIRNNENFQVGVSWIIHENDYYMSDERPIERDCHYIAIGAYAVDSNNISELNDEVLKEIKRSVQIIDSGKYDSEFTDKDKKYIQEDINIIKNSGILNN